MLYISYYHLSDHLNASFGNADGAFGNADRPFVNADEALGNADGAFVIVDKNPATRTDPLATQTEHFTT